MEVGKDAEESGAQTHGLRLRVPDFCLEKFTQAYCHQLGLGCEGLQSHDLEVIEVGGQQQEHTSPPHGYN